MTRNIAEWFGAPSIHRWVREARWGKERELLQWQKYEDTSFAHMISFFPGGRVRYINIGLHVHNFACKPYQTFHLYRAPSRRTLMLHDMKHTGHAYAWDLMRGTRTYDASECANESGHDSA